MTEKRTISNSGVEGNDVAHPLRDGHRAVQPGGRADRARGPSLLARVRAFFRWVSSDERSGARQAQAAEARIDERPWKIGVDRLSRSLASVARLAIPARAARIARRLMRTLRYVALGALTLACSPERSRSDPASSVRVEPAGAARFADSRDSRKFRETNETRDARRDPRASGASSSDSESERTEPPPRGPIALSVAELEPGVNEEFDEDTVLDLDDALSAVDENAFATLIKKEQVWINGELVKKEKTAHPDNCRRWRYFKNRGYAPKSAVAKQIDAGALVRCGSLEFLTRARPSRVTHVRDLLVGAGPTAFPAIVASATSPLSQQARERAVARGSTFAEFLPNSRVIPSELPGRLSFSEPASDSSVILNAEVWGDVNADGIEDLALSVLNSADDGSSFVMRLLHVTRPSAGAPLTVLAVVE